MWKMYEEHMLEDVWDTNLVPFSVKEKLEHKVHRSEMRSVVFCKVLNFFVYWELWAQTLHIVSSVLKPTWSDSKKKITVRF